MKKLALLSAICFVVAISVIAGFSRPAIAQETYITFTIANIGGDSAIPDVINSGDNSVYYDVNTIVGREGKQNIVAVAIDAVTTWNLTGPNAGTITIQGCSGLTFSGIDKLVGGAGEDTFIFTPGVVFSGKIDGGGGANTLDYSAYTTDVTVNLDSHTATGTNGIAQIQNVIGGAGMDTLTGDSQDNVFTGGPGPDTITGGGGHDTIIETRDANFTLTNTRLTIGAEGTDTLTGIETARLTGGPGNNTLDASSFTGSVFLDGAGGDDTLKGGSGDDVLIGGPGDDALIGGRGNDVYTGGPGRNTITEVSGGGSDTIVETCGTDFVLTATSLTWSEGVDTFSNIENIQVPNQPPTSNAGPDQSVRAGDTVSLNGGESYDDNTVSTSLGYAWSFSEIPAGSNAILADADTMTPSFVVDVAGTYVVQLIVTDEHGLAGEPDFVTISSDVNLAPTARATVDYSLVFIGETVRFDGSDSTDPENDSLSYAWTLTAAPEGSTAALVGGDTATPTLTPDLPGAYEVTLAVSDSIGPGDPATVTLTALTGEDFAEFKCYDVDSIVSALTLSQVTTKGNQTALLNFLKQAVAALQADDLVTAIDKLQKAMERTDGCQLRYAPDGNGPGRDWITDCDIQKSVYILLQAALEALTP
jgi:Ca2+-binding RTX toxin-like protein